MANSRDNVFVVVHRRLDEEEDVVQLVPRMFIMEVPDEVDILQIKRLLESAGMYQREQWREYRIYDPDELTESVGVFRPDDDSESIDYDDLMSKAQEEKRITLRLPIGLYTALVREAKYVSFNQYCINLLSNAIKFGDYSAKPQAK